MKVIFLDIDGVLNWAGTEDRISHYIGLCSERIARFNRIIKAHPDAQIVVSSTWRKGMHGVYEDLEGLARLLAKRGLHGEVIDHTPIRFSSTRRGHEIREWLEDFQHEFPGEPLTYVILDDDDDEFDAYAFERYSGLDDLGDDVYETVTIHSLRPHHVKTFYYGEQHLIGGDTVTSVEGGLQDYHVEQAIKLLSRPPQ